jgi:hypothetical protein
MFTAGVGVTMFGVFMLNSHEPHDLEGTSLSRPHGRRHAPAAHGEQHAPSSRFSTLELAPRQGYIA